MRILGISAFYHDSAAALLQDGRIIAAAQEERFTRKKHDPGFPTNAVRYCLEEAGVRLEDLDAIAFYDKPLLKFERLLETYYGFAPKGIRSFLMSMPVWMKEKLFLKKLIRDELKAFGDPRAVMGRLLFPEHHLSHAASAYYASPFTDSAVLTIDGVGEWATASICHGKGRDMTILRELRFPHSLGLLYSAFTYFCGFRVNSGEYKLMGLAPYGRAGSAEVERYRTIILQELVRLNDDGSVWLDQRYFDYAAGLRMADDAAWARLFGFPRRQPEKDELAQHHCDLALAIQQVTEEAVLRMAREARRLTGSDHLCLAGGVALNCVANGKLLESGLFRDLFIQPAAGDAGGALGAAYAAHHIHHGAARDTAEQPDAMRGGYLGPAITAQDVERTARRYGAPCHRFDDPRQLVERTAELLAEGKVVGWVNGRMEFGPRALGARSILGDPRDTGMQKKLNLKIKYRESFRPFAPAVLAEDASRYFDLQGRSPYMLLVRPVQHDLRRPLPADYPQFGIREKLYHERSSLPAITHVDFSARVQTVHRDTNPRFHALIEAFKARTGVGMLVNTSFNVRGEPIVCTPDDAYRCFMRTEMDALVVGDHLFLKHEQPAWQRTDNWKEEFVLD
ncbi:MAG: carbamoyltransferase [Flavobacteriales bacterium]|nr:Decarbamoylnovobiocin carbamoyltransferase [Flavobacteriales bacterium]MCC6577026.1 carbamoyltransferase [Flavobacteriales bacterium]